MIKFSILKIEILEIYEMGVIFGRPEEFYYITYTINDTYNFMKIRRYRKKLFGKRVLRSNDEIKKEFISNAYERMRDFYRNNKDIECLKNDLRSEFCIEEVL
ncbi:hypothetical protein [Clostridium perfringens]|uniref:hypothetical protein n=1 Tax=Clostridium perfringens TaxID=1502 RepID=UPI001E355929|nr:hypothetical protein [Clostridium perfringens]WVL78322.1 hypothetical protein LMS42_015270 [Clostridium perfringens]